MSRLLSESKKTKRGMIVAKGGGRGAVARYLFCRSFLERGPGWRFTGRRAEKAVAAEGAVPRQLGTMPVNRTTTTVTTAVVTAVMFVCD